MNTHYQTDIEKDMKKLIIRSALLLATFLAAPLCAQESVNVVINENGTQREEPSTCPEA